MLLLFGGDAHQSLFFFYFAIIDLKNMVAANDFALDLINTTGYYPFGMQMSARTFTNTDAIFADLQIVLEFISNSSIWLQFILSNTIRLFSKSSPIFSESCMSFVYVWGRMQHASTAQILILFLTYVLIHYLCILKLHLIDYH